MVTACAYVDSVVAVAVNDLDVLVVAVAAVAAVVDAAAAAEELVKEET